MGLFTLVLSNEDNLDPLIIGGGEINVDDYPWMVFMFVKKYKFPTIFVFLIHFLGFFVCVAKSTVFCRAGLGKLNARTYKM